MGVYKKKNRWYIDYYMPNGKRKREVVAIKGVAPDKITRVDAQTFFHVRKAETAQGITIRKKSSSAILFSELAHSFIEEYSKPNKRSWTRDVTSSKPLLEYFGDRRIDQITDWQAEKYMTLRSQDMSRLGKPISKATINREIACLKTMFSFAVKRKWLPSNPLSGVKLYKEKQNKLRVVTNEEFGKVYEASSDLLKLILLTAISTGMRKGEILNLQWENVNFKQGYIYVEEAKNDETRNIPMSGVLKERLKSVEYSPSSEYVFSYKGKKIGSFKTAFNGALRRAGVKPFRFHDLRHTFASNLVMAGVDIVTVQELMGHKSITMTKRYSHPTPEHKIKAVESISIDTYLDTSGKSESAKTDVTTRNH